MIVADTNLVAYLLIEGDRTPIARQVYTRDPDWRLPPLWRSEFLNVLATSVRAGVLTHEQAQGAWSAGKRRFADAEVEPGGEAVLAAALKRGISAYDAQFVVVAERLSARLVTSDRRLTAACPERAVSPADFLGEA